MNLRRDRVEIGIVHRNHVAVICKRLADRRAASGTRADDDAVPRTPTTRVVVERAIEFLGVFSDAVTFALRCGGHRRQRRRQERNDGGDLRETCEDHVPP